MNDLKITYTKILPIKDGIGGCVAVAQITFNECIKLTGIKLINDNGKKSIMYPRNLSNKQRRSYFYPTNKETADFIAEHLWADYDALEKGI